MLKQLFLALIFTLGISPISSFAGENYCRTNESTASGWGLMEEVAGSLENSGEEDELFLVQLEDGSEILLSGLEEEVGDEEILASAQKKDKKKKRQRYSNRGILGPKGKWPVKSGACTLLTGQASYYGGGEKLKKRTASGKVFSPKTKSAAHRTLPLGTKVEITNVKNGRTISSVVIDDRGPAIETNREIDVTRAVAQELGFIKSGHTQVKIKVCRS